MTSNNREVVDKSDLVCLSVKPYDVERVLDGVRDDIRSDKNIIMSVAAGVQIETIEKVRGRSNEKNDKKMGDLPNDFSRNRL